MTYTYTIRVNGQFVTKFAHYVNAITCLDTIVASAVDGDTIEMYEGKTRVYVRYPVITPTL